jgi:hypothetical protein
MNSIVFATIKLVSGTAALIGFYFLVAFLFGFEVRYSVVVAGLLFVPPLLFVRSLGNERSAEVKPLLESESEQAHRYGRPRRGQPDGRFQGLR